MAIYAAAVPPPNQNFLSPTQQPTGNYFRGGEPNKPVSHLFGGRLDYNRSASDRFFFRCSGSTFDEGAFDWTYESPTPEFRGLHDGFRERYTWSYTGNWTRTVGATVIDTQLSSNRYFQQDEYYALAQYKPSDFGLPVYMDQFCGDNCAHAARQHQRLSGAVERRKQRRHVDELPGAGQRGAGARRAYPSRRYRPPAGDA